MPRKGLYQVSDQLRHPLRLTKPTEPTYRPCVGLTSLSAETSVRFILYIILRAYASPPNPSADRNPPPRSFLLIVPYRLRGRAAQP